jgi:hypothetical protein
VFCDKYKKKNRTQTPKKRLGYAVFALGLVNRLELSTY